MAEPTASEAVADSNYRDLVALCLHAERRAEEIIEHLQSGPEGGYGPRLWLSFRRKKLALAAAREIRQEASLIFHTIMRPEDWR